MKRLVFAGLLALGACDDDEESIAGDGGVDATVSDAGDATVPDAGDAGALDTGISRSMAVANSLSVWNGLAAASPGPYWYEDENCRVNNELGALYLVEVDQDAATTPWQSGVFRSECRGLVNRFTTLAGTGTIPDLHRLCSDLLARRSDTKLAFDPQGVVSECWVSDAPNCRDNCGEGFLLLRRGFGKAPVPDAGPIPADAGPR